MLTLLKPRPRPSVAAATLSLVLLVAGCSSGDDGPTGEPGAPSSEAGDPRAGAPPELEAAWTTTPGLDLAPVTTTDDLLVFSQDDVLTTLDRATGEEVSRFTAPAGVRALCGVSPQVVRGRMLGLLMTERPSAPCTVAAALDLRTGELRWRRSLPSSDPDLRPGERDRYHEGRSVAVGDGVLLATTTCGEVRRLSLRDGRSLSVIAPRDTACRNESVTDGRVVAILDYDPVPVEYEDPSGIGFFPATDGPGAYALYDAATGRRAWSHLVPDHTSAGMSDVVSSDPLVLTSTVRGRTTTRLWDDAGRPGPFLGLSTDRAITEEPGMVVVGRTDELIVVTYPEGADPSVLHAYDLTTGAERWQLVPPAADPAYAVSAAAVTEDGLLVAAASATDTDLLRYDLDAPGAPEVLGRAKGSLVALVGDILLTRDTAMSAFTAPAEGEVREYVAMPRSARPEPAWADGDVRPEDAVGACRAVSAATVRLLDLGYERVPPPATCRWTRDRQPEYVDRELEVSVHVAEPGTGPEGEASTAVTAAEAFVQDSLKPPTGRDSGPRLAPLPDAAALGDAGWARFSAVRGSSFDGYPVRMVTRWRNVVVTVTATQALQIEDRATALVPYDRLDDTVYAATADVLGALGADASLPARGPAGPVEQVGDLCPAAAPTAADLLPGVEVAAGRAGSRQRACAWSNDGLDRLVVVANAVRGGHDGSSATDRAPQVADRLGGGRGGGAERRIEGFPGLSTLARYEDGDYRVWDATARVDNLVVWVHLGLDDDRLDRAGMDEAVARLARRAVAAARS